MRGRDRLEGSGGGGVGGRGRVVEVDGRAETGDERVILRGRSTSAKELGLLWSRSRKIKTYEMDAAEIV